MGLLSGLGIGVSSSRQSSQGSSDSASFDNLDSFGFGQSVDQSVSGGRSVSGSRDASSGRVAFEDVFAQLFGNSSNAANNINTSAITESSNLLFGSGGQFLDTLGGEGELDARLAASDDLDAQQIDLLSSDIGKFLSETVNPGITSGGVQANTLGGSRGDLQRGLASEAAIQEFVRGSTGIRRASQTRQDGLAGQIDQNRLQGANAGIGALPGLLGIAETGAFASLSPFAALSQILGPQTVLQDSAGTSFAESDNFAESAGSSISADSTTGRAGSRSTSQNSSSGKSKSFSIGF